MGRFFGLVVGVPLALLAVSFALANRHVVRVEFWPLPFSVDIALYLLSLGPLALGLVVGAVAGRLGRNRPRRDGDGA